MASSHRMFLKALTWAVFLLVLRACAVAPAPAAASWSPTTFFHGGTVGHGVLTYRDGRVDRRFEVISTQAREGAAGLSLSQEIRFDDGEGRTRLWALEQVGPDKFEGSLTDASGTVRAFMEGEVLVIRYPLADVPLGRMEQLLYLQPDRRTLINEGTVRVGGMTIRRLHEVIVRNEPLY